jgi:replicative DNA helicase
MDFAKKYITIRKNNNPILPTNPLPMALDLEASVLGACLLSDDLLLEYLENLHEGLFAKAGNELIRQAICSLAQEGKKIDVLLVAQRLRKMGCLEEIGGQNTWPN